MPPPDTGILSQVDNFKTAGGKIKRKDLVIVWGGANDYVFDLFLADPADVVDDIKIEQIRQCLDPHRAV